MAANRIFSPSTPPGPARGRANAAVARATVEPVERRVLLSGTGHHRKAVAVPPAATIVRSTLAASALATTAAPTTAKGHAGKAARKAKAAGAVTPATIAGSTTPGGLTPAQVRAAYGLGTPGGGISYPLTFARAGGAAANADGSGQTIAIVVLYNDPTAVTDLQGFDSYYGLPNPPSIQVVNGSGQASPLPATDPNGQDPGAAFSWEEEASLDLQWSHTMAPGANLILYEVDPAGDVYGAVEAAAANPAVTVVNMSFTIGEYSGETAEDASAFVTPSSHAAGGVTFLAATGDHGSRDGVTGANSATAGAATPATSPNVVAVGGTSLILGSGGTYGLETGWYGSGGGVSQYESQPAYQAAFQAATNGAYVGFNRTAPDVSADADPNTGVDFYDSFDFGAATPWAGGSTFGGTSLSTPLWSGLVAVADQGRAVAGLPSLYADVNGTAGTLPRLYQLPTGDFHDVTAGGSGYYQSAAGYDLVTGRGGPVANTLIPDLAGSASVGGRLFVDANGNGTYDVGTDAAVAGQAVYLDYNNDGVQDDNEPATVTSPTGTYAFADVPAGGTVRTATPAGDVAVPTGTSAAIAYGAGQTTNFAFFPTAYAATTAGAQYTLRTDPTGTVDQVLLNGTVTDSIARSLLGSAAFSFTLSGKGSGLTVSAANGNPMTAGGVTETGTAGASDALAVVGTAGADALAVAPGSVTFGSVAITTANVSAVSVDPDGGGDTLSVAAGGSATVPAPAAGAGLLARPFASLSVAAGGSLSFATAAAHADRQVVVASALSDAGTIDLGGNDLIVRGGSLPAVTALAAAGFNGGRWTGGTGLASAAAASDAHHLTALGVAVPTASGSFDGQPVSATDVLVKYTRYGDANLDGVVNAADYTRTDAGFVMRLSGWANGDFNYDGVVDGSDYTLIDNDFNQQAGTL